MSKKFTYWNSFASINPNFISTWDTTKAGSASDTIVLPLLSGGTYSGTIDWGDATTSVLSYANRSHTYASGGVYTITLSGTIEGWRFNNSGDDDKIISIDNWGALKFTNASHAFYGCSNLESISATDYPDSSSLTDMDYFFGLCPKLTSVDFTGWDLSNVTEAQQLFFQDSLLESVTFGDADFSSMTKLLNIFYGCGALSSTDINDIDISNVTDLQQAFYNCGSIDIDISGWVVTQVDKFLNFMSGVTLSTSNYDALLIAWDAQGAMSYSGTVNFGSSKYTSGGAAEAARTSLISKWGGIMDGGAA